jgi:hypothetical protein
VLRIFIALKNPSPWPGFESATFGSSGQHTNQYTTKATDPRFAGSNPAEDDGLLRVKKNPYLNFLKRRRKSHVVRFYGVLK